MHLQSYRASHGIVSDALPTIAPVSFDLLRREAQGRPAGTSRGLARHWSPFHLRHRESSSARPRGLEVEAKGIAAVVGQLINGGDVALGLDECHPIEHTPQKLADADRRRQRATQRAGA